VEETMVIDRVGNELFAERAADIIGATQIRGDRSDGSVVDVTIILGKDFDGRYVR
jgi:polyisoprenyl-teichoic acid--peptidoglycan teichoic acid transferase